MENERREANGAPPGASRPRRRRRLVLPVLLLILAIVLVGTYWFVRLRGRVTTDDAYVDADAMTIGAKMLGRVTALLAAQGDAVHPGQLLVELDDSDLRAEEGQAKASLELARRNVPVAKIDLDRAQEDFDRASFQYTNKVFTKEQFDHARQALDMAEARYRVALSQVDVAKARLDAVETQLGNTKVLAPQAGVVARKWVMEGDVVQPGQAILTLFDLGHVWVTANFEETRLAEIHVGDPVELKVDAFRGRHFSGTVSLIGAAAASRFSLIPPNNASGNFTKVTQRIPVRISIEPAGPDPAGEPAALLPGMSVVVTMHARGE